MKKFSLNVLVTILVVWMLPSVSFATVEYARQTGYQCSECHIEAIGGGPLTDKGNKFIEEMKVKGLFRPLSTTQKVVRFIIAYVHLLTAIAWFGTILYVHILLKPAYAAKGLPKGELFLGWLSIIILAVTGSLLTIARIPSWKMFYLTKFGILLSVKILLFLVMASTAVIVTFFIGPRIRKKRMTAEKGEPGDFTPDDLLHYNGKDSRPAYVAYKGIVYDVTTSKLWKDGSHLRKHLAGHDLTDALKTAPHGDEKIHSMPRIGKMGLLKEKPRKPFHERLFYFFAYMNLAFVFLIVLVIALMRWG